MVEYRAQLDKERESALAKGRNRPKRKVRLAKKTKSRALRATTEKSISNPHPPASTREAAGCLVCAEAEENVYSKSAQKKTRDKTMLFWRKQTN